jgi:hypothetical protein
VCPLLLHYRFHPHPNNPRRSTAKRADSAGFDVISLNGAFSVAYFANKLALPHTPLSILEKPSRTGECVATAFVLLSLALLSCPTTARAQQAPKRYARIGIGTEAGRDEAIKWFREATLHKPSTQFERDVIAEAASSWRSCRTSSDPEEC